MTSNYELVVRLTDFISDYYYCISYYVITYYVMLMLIVLWFMQLYGCTHI